MRTEDRHIVRAWLEAERAGRTDEADRRFRHVAVALPRLEPSWWFTGRVMARLGFLRWAGGDVWRSWWLRGMVAASVVTLGAALGTWTARSALFTAVASAETVGWGVSQASVGVGAWARLAFTVWTAVAHAGLVVGRLLASPETAFILMLNLAVAASAAAALQRLLARQEE